MPTTPFEEAVFQPPAQGWAADGWVQIARRFHPERPHQRAHLMRLWWQPAGALVSEVIEGHRVVEVVAMAHIDQGVRPNAQGRSDFHERLSRRFGYVAPHALHQSMICPDGSRQVQGELHWTPDTHAPTNLVPVQVVRKYLQLLTEQGPLVPLSEWALSGGWSHGAWETWGTHWSDETPSLPPAASEGQRQAQRVLTPAPDPAFAWPPVEDAIRYYRDVHDAAQVTHPPVEDRARMAQWLAWAQPDAPLRLPTDWQQGPLATEQGLSLATTLVWAWRTPGFFPHTIGPRATGAPIPYPQHNEARLQQVLEEASDATLHQWCTQPDASGCTLPMHVVCMSADPRTLGVGAPALEAKAIAAMLDRLAMRIPLTQVVWHTDQWSLDGWMLHAVQDLERHPQWPEAMGRVNAVMAHLETHGVDWLAMPFHSSLMGLNEDGDPTVMGLHAPAGWTTEALHAVWAEQDPLGSLWVKDRRSSLPAWVDATLAPMQADRRARALERTLSTPAMPPRRPRL